MPRFTFAPLVALGILCGLPPLSVHAEEAARPNIILIMCDDMGYEGVSAYGSESYKTPNLDRLAAEGMLLTHCYAQPICTPSRVQIMTGRYNFRNYVDFGTLDTKEVTFGNVLRDAGYDTAIAGKWQLGGDAQTVKNFGFDHHCLWHIGGRDSRFWNPRIVRDGEVVPGLEDAFGPDVMCDYVADYIGRKRDKPFFVYYPMMLVHWPFVPTPDSPPGGSRERSGEYDGQGGGVEYFDDMIAYMDKLIGRIVTKLDETGQRENTLLLFTGDNGCATNIVSRINGTTVHGGKGSMPDAGTHVALVANWPAQMSSGKLSGTLVDFSDLLPTLAEAGGAKLPDDLTIDGRSFLPQLRGERGNPREWVFCHYSRNGRPKEPNNAEQRQQQLDAQAKQREAKQLGRFVRNQRFKLYDDGRLYDVSADVLEQHPIPPGEGSAEAEAARKAFQAVHDSMSPWKPFR